ncbi:MAG: anaerobic ribonucleoside-triphosphate reductase activating protein [Patescibacteria group bacterium]|nr:anaerobic ribonucleoside-triphosphate reductase activating protein [Patescibacteria group bacterium]
MKIAAIQKLTLIDYPGKLACTVFLAGCNYRCIFCYNPELVLPKEIEKQSKISEKEFFQFLKKRKGMLEGVTIGGGEPMVNEDLPEFCQKIKKLGYQIKIDTNGSNPEMLRELIDQKLVDCVAMDIKAPKEKYPEVIGFKNCSRYYLLSKIEDSINILKENKIDYEFRSTVCPKLLSKKDILEIVHWLAPAKKYFLQNFKGGKTIDPRYKNFKPYSQNYLLEIQKAISPFFETCQIR